MKTLLTGIKPTGQPHLGNYTGAIRPALEQINQSQYKSYLFIADYHSFTTIQEPQLLSHVTYQVACTWLACGVDTQKTIIYRQSDIPELFELYWILTCLAPKGLLNRAHSYKAYLQENSSKKDKDQGIYMGVFNYPILMAADILLFQAEVIPVGKDQVQHLEIARDLATKFNHIFKSSVMVLPQMIQEKNAASLVGLDGRKMSKSYGNHIPLFCSEKDLKKQIMKIKTDSLPPEAPKKTDDSILFSIFKEFATAGQTQELKQKMLKGCGWGEVKQDLFDLLNTLLKPKREIYNSLMNDTQKVDRILKEGALKAREQARVMLDKVRQTIGIKK